MITGRITGDREVLATFNRMPGGLQDKLAKTITRLCLKLQVHVVQDKLSGQVLNVKTGRLRRSITYAVTTPGASSVQGTVGTNVAYGRFFELGFQGTENVKEHLRRIREHGTMVLKAAKGHDMKVWAKQRGKLTGDEVVVRAYTRHVDMPAHSFLGSALNDMRPEILEQINQTVKESTR